MKTEGSSHGVEAFGRDRRLSRRGFLKLGGSGLAGAALLGSGTLAGCGGGTPRGEGGSAGTRRVKHALGETRIPSDPRRVVALDSFIALPALLDAGVPVVGALSVSAISGGGTLPSYLTQEEADGIEIVGGAESGPNLEAIAALEPDVIVVWSVLIDDQLYEDLNRIAPTVATEGVAYLGGDWRDEARGISSWFGAEEGAEARISAYEERVGELGRRVGERLGNPSVSALRITEDQLLLYYSCFWPGSVLAEAGLRRPQNQQRDDGCPSFQEQHADVLSLEKLPEADADALFYYVGGGRDGAEALKDRMTENPLWRSLHAVQNDRAFAVGGDAWLFANARAADLVLDDLEKHLLGGDTV